MGYLLDDKVARQLDGQRDVVKNEKRQSVRQPALRAGVHRAGSDALPARRIPTAGRRSARWRTSRPPASRTWSSSSRPTTSPNNASLVIAGDIDIAADEDAGREVVRRRAARAAGAAAGRAAGGARRREDSKTITDACSCRASTWRGTTPALYAARRRGDGRRRRTCWPAARTRASTSGWSTTCRSRRTSRAASSRRRSAALRDHRPRRGRASRSTRSRRSIDEELDKLRAGAAGRSAR